MAKLSLYTEDLSEEFREAYNIFADKNGQIKLDKLKKVLYEIGEPLEDPEDFTEMRKIMGNKSATATITFGDFEKICKKNPKDFI
jgi:Ca2+-binding EF-hand superfamily protein